VTLTATTALPYVACGGVLVTAVDGEALHHGAVPAGLGEAAVHVVGVGPGVTAGVVAETSRSARS
jgi:hypothetical protein